MLLNSSIPDVNMIEAYHSYCYRNFYNYNSYLYLHSFTWQLAGELATWGFNPQGFNSLHDLILKNLRLATKNIHIANNLKCVRKKKTIYNIYKNIQKFKN